MAIDTALKRKSLINAGIPGAVLSPGPDALIEAIDRRHLTDLYSLGAQVISHNFWVPDTRDSSISWAADRRASETWVQDQNASSNWEQDERISDN